MDPLKLLQAVHTKINEGVKLAGEHNSVVKALSTPPSQYTPEDRQAVNNLVIGSTFGNDVTFSKALGQAVPKLQNANYSDAAEVSSGWQPGAKAKFDFAILSNDVPTIKAMLPQVPEGYLVNKFGPGVYEKLLQAAKGSTNPATAAVQAISPAFKVVSKGIMRAIPK